MVKAKSYKSPYVLDTIKNNESVTALTKKNAEFIEAVVHLDSNYGSDLNKNNKPANGYDPELYDDPNKSFSRDKRGSTAYWFNQTAQGNADFRKCILGAIIAIDSVNSTHLDASQKSSTDNTTGRKAMRDIICDCCKDFNGLVEKLNQPFDASTPDHLICLLTGGMVSKKDKNHRYNISFATKFCAYAAMFLGSEVKKRYSKYDRVVANALPTYEEIYLSPKKVGNYRIDYNKEKGLKDEDKLRKRLEVYARYDQTIGEILAVLQKDGIRLTREEFDHIVWYTNK